MVDSMCERTSRTTTTAMCKAQVVYYLCRGGKMEPPHMIEVPHSHYDGLRLKDVKHRLTVLRGGGMPSMFSWSCKRLYKNAHIWQDVCDEDSLTPASGGEYVLKGSEYFESSQDTKTSSFDRCEPPVTLQRKFKGAESWLKTSPKATSRGEHASYHMSRHMRTLTMDSIVRRPADNTEEHKISNAGASSEDSSGMHDIGVCEVSRSIRPPPGSDPFQDVRIAQAEDPRYSSQEYKSGNSTPNCLGSDRKLMYPEQRKQQLGQDVEQEGAKLQNVKSKRRLLAGKKPSHNVKMKQSAASCAFLHILSYCGGVETKAQNSAPPTEIASSEYSFDGGICSAENKHASATAMRSPQYSVSSMDMSNKDSYHRSGPLIPYSSEYFDVKETVTPPPASPLQGKASKAISRCSSK